jgi:acyl transferase domain-containing protein
MTDLSARLDHLTPLQRAAYALKETQNRLHRMQQQQRQSIAIVGMSCRFPGSCNDIESYWQLLANNRDAISEVPLERWDVEKYYDPDPSAPGKMVTKWGGFIDNAAAFDNHFFGISDREAVVTDPQQRILLELTWEALEDAGLPPSQLRSRKVGVFVGMSTNEYLTKIIQNARDGSSYASIGNSSAAAANRISYAFDFRGPSLAIDTACSSAIFALHQACNSLRNNECELAVVAAANLMISPLTTINLTKAGVCSPDGKIKAFDAAANGYVRGDGVGVLILKRDSDAANAGDRVHAFVLATATNHNGTSNSLTAPRRESQEAAMRDACTFAQVAPDSISYVEAHATGTPIGDSIELSAINNVYGVGHSKDNPLRIGAVKTNIGHTEAASGLAGIIKVVLAMKHRKLPATLHFQRPHPDSILAASSIHVPTQIEDWSSSSPLVAAVNATGFGGSNGHVLIQESNHSTQTPERVMESEKAQVLAISARTESSLRAYAESLIPFLRITTSTWEDICWTAACKREALECRLAVVASSKAQAVQRLRDFLNSNSTVGVWNGRVDSPMPNVNSATSNSQNDVEDEAVGFVQGKPVNWQTRYPAPGHQVELPLYAWQRRRHWIDNPEDRGASSQQIEEVAAIDQAASDVLLTERPELSVAYVPPADALEQWIADQWSQVLNVSPIGTRDNFFELGGDSLQATGLLNRLQQAGGESIPVTALFDAQNIESLADYLRHNHASSVERIINQQRELTDQSVAPQSPATAQDLSSIVRRRDKNQAKKYVQELDDKAVEELLRKKLTTPQAPRDSHV